MMPLENAYEMHFIFYLVDQTCIIDKKRKLHQKENSAIAGGEGGQTSKVICADNGAGGRAKATGAYSGRRGRKLGHLLRTYFMGGS